MKLSKIVAASMVAVGAITLASCSSSDADLASGNLSKAAEQFEVNRRITVVNGVTDKYVMLVEGRCSLEFPEGRTEIVCKLENGTFVKHHVIMSDNVFIMSEQINGTVVDTDQYRVIFKPEVIIPNVDRP